MMKFLFFLGLVCLVAGVREKYDNYKVYRVNPKTLKNVEFLNAFQDNFKTLDFWKNRGQVGESVDVMVPPQEQALFEAMIRGEGMETTAFVDDVQKLIDSIEVKNTTGKLAWTEYYTLSSIHSWLDELAKAYPSIVTIVNGGSSYEKRTIKGIVIKFATTKKPAVLIEGGIHAREWISPATVTYIINELLTSTDPAWKKIAQSFEWHIFPVVNPDGYEYTHTSSRLWRKTRTPYGTCAGADPNRNWDAHWLEQGASTVACSETYAGPAPFSEVETKSFSSYISTIGSRLVSYIAFHSYGQYLLLPYGHTTEHLDNYDEAMEIGRTALTALTQRYGTKYTIGNIAEAIYKASGGSIDWVKQEFQSPMVYCFESRDTGTYGFVLPANQIIPNALETMDALTAMFQKGETFGYYVLG